MINFSDAALGERVVIRYRLADGRSGSHFSDALGELQEVTAAAVSVQTRTGVVVIPRTAITHAKRVPPPPARRRPREPRSS